MNMRRLGLLLLLTVFGGAFWWMAAHREPSYQGRPISSWIEEIKVAELQPIDPGSVFRAMGPQALPRLFGAIQCQEPWWRRSCREIAAALPARLQARLPVPRVFNRRKEALFQDVCADVARSQLPESLPFVLGQLRGSRPVASLAAAEVLAGSTYAESEVLGVLVRAVREPDTTSRQRALAVLCRLGPKASAAVPAAIEALRSDESGASPGSWVNVRGFAARFLAKVGPAASAAIPGLQEAMGGTNPIHRVEAAIAIWKIRGDASEPLAVLLKEFTAYEPYLRWTLIDCLGEMGTNATAAVPLLLAQINGTLHDGTENQVVYGDAENRSRAFEALLKIAPDTAKRLGAEGRRPQP